MNVSLTRNKSTGVSRIDYKFLCQWKWYAWKSTEGRWYAVRAQNRKVIWMHRVIAARMGIDLSYEIDHKDDDSLNNHRSNLRSATHAQNGHNRKRQRNNTSGIKGVCWDSIRSRWYVQIRVNRQRKFLGRFTNKRLATLVYSDAAKRLHKEFSRC
jgi:hypothetical protein